MEELAREELLSMIDTRLDRIRVHCDPHCFRRDLTTYSLQDLLYVYGKITAVENLQDEMFEKIGY